MNKGKLAGDGSSDVCSKPVRHRWNGGLGDGLCVWLILLHCLVKLKVINNKKRDIQ